MYVLGVDVGGTKTECVVADEKEKIMGRGFGGGGNHQMCGIEKASESMRKAVSEALAQANITLADVAYAVFGIAGADGPKDMEVLVPAVKKIMGTVQVKILHDAWLGLRAGTEDYVGVVSICGTGAGHVGRNHSGQELSLRNLDYIMGNFGGGGDLEEKALHYAFRSEEGTWQKSRLEDAIPKVFGVEGMEEVCEILRDEAMTKEQQYQLPITVFTLAREGDEVSRGLISSMGYEEGKYAAAVLKRLDMCSEPVPAVLIGSLFRTREPLLIDAYMKALWETAPKAYAVIPETAPVMGAVKLAIDAVKEQQADDR
ncbi:MAG: hypothetical protein HDR11_16110 [Lachnospiraceae bacterium]|nr:hypothetical protein [Lachnospiraceae bacterium]MBD5499247.1 hypothetical protein [Lachnospiraceae bacterium]